MTRPDMLIDTRTIARIAHVTPAAVSNWRRRHESFPAAAHTSGKSPLYMLSEIEKWLVEEGRINGRIPDEDLLFPMLDVIGYELDLDGVVDVLTVIACYATVATGNTTHPKGIDSVLPDQLLWPTLRDETPKRRRTGLRNALIVIGGALRLDLASTLDLVDSSAENVVDAILTTVTEMLAQDLGTPTDLEIAIEEYIRERDKHADQHMTPEWVRGLIVALAAPTGSVIADPACGTGRLLRAASWHSQDAGPELVGNETNHAAAWRAQLWMVIHNVDGTVDESSGIEPTTNPYADTVVTWPPMGVGNWGNADVLLDDRWTLAPVAANDATTAWVQTAWQALRPGGRAVIGLPPHANFANRNGLEQLRETLATRQLLEAVIHLPRGTLNTTSIPVSLWVLTADPTGQPPLIVDATHLTAAPSINPRLRSTVPAADVAEIAEVIEHWRRTETVLAGADSWAVVADPARSHELTFDRHRPLELRSIDDIRADLLEVESDEPTILSAVADTASEGRRTYDTSTPAPNSSTTDWSPGRVTRVPLHKLADVLIGVRAEAIDPGESMDLTETAPLLRVADLDGRLAPTKLVDTREHGDAHRIQSGDLAVQATSSTAQAVQVHPAPDAWVGAVPSQDVAIIRPKTDESTAAWLKVWLQSPIGATAVRIDAYAGTNMVRLSRTDLEAIEIPVPTGAILREATRQHQGLADHASRLRAAAAKLERQADLVAELAATVTHAAAPDG